MEKSDPGAPWRLAEMVPPRRMGEAGAWVEIMLEFDAIADVDEVVVLGGPAARGARSGVPNSGSDEDVVTTSAAAARAPVAGSRRWTCACANVQRRDEGRKSCASRR